MSRLFKIAFVIASLSLATPVIASAFAQKPASTRVTYGDLDLSKEAGAKVLLGRITSAATRVCGPAPLIKDIVEHRTFRTCIFDTTAWSVAKLDAPAVTALFNRQTGPVRTAGR